MRDQVRKIVAKFMHKDVRFVELDFQPHAAVEKPVGTVE
jgi:hypothetical protein